MMNCRRMLMFALWACVAVVVWAPPVCAGIAGDEKNDQRIEKMVREGREEYLKKKGEKPFEGTVYSPTEYTPDKARSPEGGPPAKPGKPDGASPGASGGGGGKGKPLFSGSGRADQ